VQGAYRTPCSCGNAWVQQEYACKVASACAGSVVLGCHAWAVQWWVLPHGDVADNHPASVKIPSLFSSNHASPCKYLCVKDAAECKLKQCAQGGAGRGCADGEALYASSVS
jgi:hypothetical protein